MESLLFIVVFRYTETIARGEFAKAAIAKYRRFIDVTL